MNRKNLSLIVSILMLCGVVTFLSLVAWPRIAMAEPSPTGATIASDYPDYVPGATVTLTGAGWQPGEAVHIFVNDDAGRTWSHNSDPDPIADDSGGFTYQFRLPTWFVANYTVTATGPLSGTATTAFTDLSIGTYDQCSNDLGSGYTSGDMGCRWINGNLQGNNSYYAEGDATVQRVWLTGFAPGTTHTVTLKYGTTKGGKHAYDFLTTWDWSEDWVKGADRCQGITGCATVSETTLDIPQDPNVPDSFEPSASGARQFVMRGGTLNSATTPAIVSGDYADNSETVITVDFTVADSGDLCPTSGSEAGTCGVVIWFGAHVATQANWGLGMGAGSISGSPYHVALDKVDRAPVGERDNQMQANAVTVIPPGWIIITKDAIPNDPQDFSFNLNNNSTISQDFLLDDDGDNNSPGLTLSNSLTFEVPPGTWYATEILPLPTGWTLANLDCVDPTSNTTVNGAVATINLASVETVTCTYTDSRDQGSLRISKIFDPLSSGFSGKFTINYDCDDGVAHDGAVELAAGEFATISGIPTGTSCTVSESILPTAPDDWTFGVPSISPEGPVTITSTTTPVEVTVTNTITRDQGYLKISKVLDPMIFTFDGNFTIGYNCGGGDQMVELAAGASKTVGPFDTGTSCTVSEPALPTPPTGWTFGVPSISGSPAIIIKGDQAAAVEVTVTNTITRDFGSLKITKTLSNPDGAPVPASFAVNYSCDNDGTLFGGTVNVAPGSFQTVSGIPTGSTCTVTEVDPEAIPGYTWSPITYSPESVTIDIKDGIFEIVVGNAITRDRGNLEISKTLSNPDGAPVPASFKVNYSCENGGTLFGGMVNVAAGSSQTVSGIPTGYTCSITEVAPTPIPGYTWAAVTYDPQSILIGEKGATFTVTAVNAILKDRGTLEIIKSLSNPDGAPVPATFEIGYDCGLDTDDTALTGSFDVAPGTPVYVYNIPTGNTCTITEVTPTPIPGYTWADVTYDPQSIEISAKNTTFTVTAVNAILRDRGSFKIIKTVTGGSFNGSFDVHVVCTGDGGTYNPSISFPDPGFVVIENIPTGNECTVTEPILPTPPVGYAWAPPVITGSPAIISKETTAEVTVANKLAQDLTVTKTAVPTFTRTWDWTITKDFDATYNLFTGQSVTHGYQVTVTPNYTDSAWRVVGTITISNPNSWQAIEANVSDATNVGGTCVLDDPTQAVVTVPASNSVDVNYTCTWASAPGSYSGTNTATVTWDKNVYSTPGDTASGTKDFEFANPIEVNPTITVDDDNLTGETWSADRAYAEWTYTRDFACSTNPSDYTDGKYSYIHTNTATITEIDQADTATVGVTCYAPHVTKTAQTYWNRDWGWTIVKGYDGSYNLFAGEDVTHNYKVTVTPTYTDNFWGVEGSITVYNYHPTEDMTLSSLTDLAGGIDAVVTCPDPLVVPHAVNGVTGTLDCTYDTGAQNSPEVNPFGDTNTATAVFADADWTGTASILFSDIPSSEDQPVITVEDDNMPGEFWSANRAALELTYTREFTCSTTANYINGKYSYSHTNTATITETGLADTATVNVNCFAPKVTKTAATYWNRDWDWTITKDFDAAYNLFPGDTVTHGYQVTVDPTYTDNFWGVTGTITVYNYHPTADMTLTSLTDLAGGINADVNCDSLIVPAAGSLTCTYDSGEQDSPDENPFGDLNTATAVFAGADWTGTYPIVFSATPTTEDDPVITVDDDNLTGESWSADRASGEWTYTRPFACSTDLADYTNGKYSYSHTNTATINQTGQSEIAKVDVTCYWPQIELAKSGDELSKIGDFVYYDITLFNNTPVDAGLRDLSCTINDPTIKNADYPDGFSKIVDLASGAVDENLDIEFTIPETDEDPFANTAWVGCKPVVATAPMVGDSTFRISDSASWSTQLFQPAVEIVKTGPVLAISGDPTTYAFTITNLSSSDSPSLILDNLTDDKLGDLADDAPAACDELAPGASCTFTASFTHNLDDPLKPVDITNIVTVHYHPDGFPNDVSDTDDHTLKLLPAIQATDSSLCFFDRDPDRNGQQFRLLFTQDPQAWPSYKVTATNPGQFFYNVFAAGTPGEPLTFNITLPYPFVTQGANPLHGYAGVTTYTNDSDQTCFMPEGEFFVDSTQVTLDNYIPDVDGFYYENLPGGEDGDGGDSVSTYTINITVTVPASGFVYVNLHLDYGLKGSGGFGKDGYGNAVKFGTGTDPIENPFIYLVPQLADHTFTVSVNGAQEDSTYIENVNTFKRNPGVGGLSRWVNVNRDPVVGATITLKRDNLLVSTTLTDEDGWYQIYYKHTGRPTIYTVTINKDGHTQTKTVTLKANGFVQVDFDLPVD